MFLAAAALFLLFRVVPMSEALTWALSLVSLPGMAAELFLRLALGATGVSTMLPYWAVDALVFGTPACVQGLTYAVLVHVLQRRPRTSFVHPVAPTTRRPAGRGSAR